MEQYLRGKERRGEKRSVMRSVSVPQDSSCYKLPRQQRSREPVLWESGPTEINEHDTPPPGLCNIRDHATMRL